MLDLGCGDGVVTQQLVAAGCRVVGVDSSPELLESAVGLGLDARLMDGHELTFDTELDAVFSHAALHWMTKDPSAVLKVLLRPQARTTVLRGSAQDRVECARTNDMRHLSRV